MLTEDKLKLLTTILSEDKLLPRLKLTEDQLMYLQRNIILNLYTIEKLLTTPKLLNLIDNLRDKRLDKLLPENLFTEPLAEIRLFKDLLLRFITPDIFNLQSKERTYRLTYKKKLISTLPDNLSMRL